MTDTPALTLPFRAAPAPTRQPPRPAGARARFTLDGSAELEDHLARMCEQIAAGLRGLLPRGKLEAVLLGGGYGRGEGGVLRAAGVDRPYNDLEFYVCLRGNRHLNERLHGHALHVLGEILTPQAGIEVEFKITSLDEIYAGAVSMFSYDLVSGHRWLLGREQLLDGCSWHRDASLIPLEEATRLLMNRCSGLLLAQELLGRERQSPADADFIVRNIAKAELALGDAVLVSRGEYHWSVRERHRRLLRLERQGPDNPWVVDVCRFHTRGTAFKLRPQRSEASRESLQAQLVAVRDLAWQVWQWIESRRLQIPFKSAAQYATSPADKTPGYSRVRNALVNAKVLGLRASLGRGILRHPRDRVLRALALLLWEPEILTSPALLTRVQAELVTRAATFPDLVRAYRERWRHVS